MSSKPNKVQPKAEVEKRPKTFAVITLSQIKVVAMLGGKQHNFLPLKRYEFPLVEKEEILKQLSGLIASNQLKVE